MKKTLLLLVLVLMLTLAFAATALAAPADVEMAVEGLDGGTYLARDDFDPEERTYDLEIDPNEDDLDLYVYYNDADYTVTVTYDGDEIKEYDVSSAGYYRYVIEIDPDDLALLRVAVKDEETGDTTRYSFILEQGDEDEDGADELEDLSLNIGRRYSDDDSDQIDLLPKFDSSTTNYIAYVPNPDEEDDIDLNLRFFLEDDRVDLVIGDDDDPVDLDDEDYYDYRIKVYEGDSEVIDFSVEGADYRLTIYFAAEDADDDAYLDSLVIRSRASSSATYALALTPEFDEDVTAYALTDSKNYSRLYLYAEADRGMTILINGQPFTGDYWSFDPDDYKKITVTVLAENYDDQEEYTITLGDQAAATLTRLSIASNTNTTVQMSPAFKTGVYNYIANVANSVSSIRLNFTAGLTVRVEQNNSGFAVRTSGDSYNLNEGLNTFDVLVGTTHYYLNVYRQASGSTIVSSNQSLSLNNGAANRIAAYNINGNNFVKLRDVAQLLSGTDKQFSVGYNNISRVITLTSGSAYVPVGGELQIPGSYARAAVTSQSVYLNGSYIYPMAYNIDDNNYFLLRDLAALFDFDIDFSGATVYINTTAPYTTAD